MIKDGHISPNQLIAIFFILVMAKEMDPAILVLIHWGHSAADLLLMISQLGIIALMTILLPLFKDPSKNLIDHIAETFGPIIGTIFGMMLFIPLLMDVSMSVTFDSEQIRSVFLPTTPVAVTLFVCILAMIIPVYYGVEVLGRANLIVFGMLVGILIAWDMLTLKSSSIQNLPPILGPGIPTLLQSGVLHVGFLGEFIDYLMLRPYVRSYTSYRRSFYIVAFATLIIGMIRLAIVQMKFPYPIDDNLFFPFMEAVKLIYFGRYIQHVEAVYAVIWLVVALARLGLMMYLLALMAASIARAHNYRRFAPSIAALIFYGALIPPTLSDAIDFKDVILSQKMQPVYGGVVVLLALVKYFQLFKQWRAKKKTKVPSTSHAKPDY